ncbi:MAG: hypothetical protein KDA20_06735 [Phycisphaerales bacterium]|nr:hypothetical protein [Phycisphaerales bacterium]
MNRFAVIALTVLLLLPAVAGCSRKVGGSKLTRLEARVDELEATNRKLAAERGELDAKVTELSRALDATTGTAAGAVVAALPRCAEIEFDRLTALVDRDGKPGFEAVDVYIRPIDGRRRFVQVAGNLRVQVLAYPAAADADSAPRVVGEVTLGPAYRSGLTGTHYAAPVALTQPIGQVGDGAPAAVELVAQFDDLVTGVRHLATRQLDIGR